MSINQPTTPTPTTPTTPATVALALYGAVLAGDVARVHELVSPTVTLDVPGTHAQAGRHDGVDGILAFLADTRAATDDGEHLEVLDVLDGREHAAIYLHVTATRAGRPPLDNHTVHLAHVTGGVVDAIWIHNRADGPVNDFWS